MPRNCRRTLLSGMLAGVAWVTWAHAAAAEGTPDPEVGYVFPAGGRAGQTVDVRLGIYEWTPDVEYLLHDPRVKLEILGPAGRLIVPERPYPVGQKAYDPLSLPREIPARFHIPADMPVGPVRWQLVNANGSSRTGVFVVGDTAEVVENEDRDAPQRVPDLPVTISGRLVRCEEIDRYVVRAPHNGPITCAIAGRRIGSRCNVVLEVHDAAGRLLSDVVDSRGLDPSVTFAAEGGNEYTVSVRDLDFRGHRSYVYRLGLTAGPRVLAALPSAGRPGETREVEFIGLGLAGGAAGLERVTQTVTFPKGSPGEMFAYRLETPFGVAPPVRLLLSDLAESVENEHPPGHAARHVVVPAGVTSTFDRRDPRHEYTFESKSGETWSIRVESRSFDAPVDPTVTLFGPDGKELAANDDLPDTADAGLEFKAAADGRYRIVVQSQSMPGRYGADVYRLSINRPQPDFSLEIPQRLGVFIGDKGELAVKAVRTGGFQEPITLSLAPLPEGMTVPKELVIPREQTELKIPVQVAADAPANGLLSTLTGSATVGGVQITRTAQARAEDNLAAATFAERAVPRIVLANLMKPRMRIWPVESDERTVNRGSTHLSIVGIERLEGFQGEVLLQLESKQPNKFRQGILGPDVILPPGADRILYPCFVPEGRETLDAYRVSVSALAQVPDPRGKPRWLVSKMQSTVSIAITVEGGLLNLSCESPGARLAAGRTTALPLRLVKSPRVPGPVVVETTVPAALSGLIEARPFAVPPDRESFDLPINVSSGIRPGRVTLTLRATATLPGEVPRLSDTAGATPLDAKFLAHLRQSRLPVISETEVPVEVVVP